MLSRAVIELFGDDGLANTLALRGGTALYKLFLERPYRYSEDIDLVQIETGPIGSAIDAIRGTLDPWLGRPRRSSGPGTVTLTYRFESEIAPVRPMRLKIEINTREHFSLLGWKSCKFAELDRVPERQLPRRVDHVRHMTCGLQSSGIVGNFGSSPCLTKSMKKRRSPCAFPGTGKRVSAAQY